MRVQYRNASGFTLVELLVVVGMIGIFMGAVFSLYRTHQRSAYTQEETVEVQQNMRVAMDKIMDDIRMGGFMLTPGTTSIGAANDNVGLGASDAMTINIATSSLSMARKVTNPLTPEPQTVTLAVGGTVNFTVNRTDLFQVGDIVTIVSGMNGNQVIDDTFTLTEVNDAGMGPCTGGAAAPCLNLRADTIGGTGTIKPGDMVVGVGTGPYPNTITYALVNNVVDPNCAVGQTCLQRATNDGVPAQIIATNITGLQFSYLLDNGLETPAPTGLTQVRAVRATLTGQRVITAGYRDRAVAPINLVSMAAIRN